MFVELAVPVLEAIATQAPAVPNPAAVVEGLAGLKTGVEALSFWLSVGGAAFLVVFGGATGLMAKFQARAVLPAVRAENAKQTRKLGLFVVKALDAHTANYDHERTGNGLGASKLEAALLELVADDKRELEELKEVAREH